MIKSTIGSITQYLFLSSDLIERQFKLVNSEFLHVLRALHGFPLHMSMDVACFTHQDQATMVVQAQ
jgi:hypothetical protein